jgi:alanine racemase
VQVKLDTGLSRNGLPLGDWPQLIDALRAARADGFIDLVAVWSHLADGDTPGAGSVASQRESFVSAIDLARARGLDPGLLHLSNSGALWAFPDCRFDLVRTGIAMYGLSPAPGLGTSRELGLVPAMTLRAELAHVKSIDAGTSVSYGCTWTSAHATTVGLVPVGYADGIPRASGGRVEVTVAGQRRSAVGRTAMDQFVIDLGPSSGVSAGDEVVLFGPGTEGELTADEWAARIDTIGYEVITRIGPRVPRRYIGASALASGDDGVDES